jgi:hypothetical protein
MLNPADFSVIETLRNRRKIEIFARICQRREIRSPRSNTILVVVVRGLRAARMLLEPRSPQRR